MKVPNLRRAMDNNKWIVVDLITRLKVSSIVKGILLLEILSDKTRRALYLSVEPSYFFLNFEYARRVVHSGYRRN
jgi:hypothetical protein